MSERNASIKWAEKFQDYLGCVRCSGKSGLQLRDHGGKVIDPKSLPLEKLQARIDEYDVWCSKCEHAFLRLRMFTKGRIANKASAAEFASIAVYAHYSRGGMAYNAYTLEKDLSITKKDFVEVAKDTPCAICENHFPAPAMDFLHLVEPKIKAVGSMTGGHWTLHQMITEMEKCVVLCANCHRLHQSGHVNLDNPLEKLWKYADFLPKVREMHEKLLETVTL